MTKSGHSEVTLYHISSDTVPLSVTGSSSAVNGGTRVGPSAAAGRTEMLNLLVHLQKWRNNNGTKGRLAVVSHDGVAKVGVFCTATYCYEEIEARGRVDVFQAVRNAKKFRPQLVSNITEYKFCYDLVLEYVSKHSREML